MESLRCNDPNPPFIPDFLWDQEGEFIGLRHEDIAGYIASQKLTKLEPMSPEDMRTLHKSLRSYRNQMLKACCFSQPSDCPYVTQCHYVHEMVNHLLDDNPPEKVGVILGSSHELIESITTTGEMENRDCRVGNTLRHFQLMDEYIQDKRSKGPSKWITRDFYRTFHRRMLQVLKQHTRAHTKLIKLASSHREVADLQREINTQEGRLTSELLAVTKATREMKDTFWRPK